MGLEEAVHAERRRVEEAAKEPTPTQLAQEQRERENKLIDEALEFLRPLQGERFVIVDRDEICAHVDEYRNRDRFESEDGQVWRVVDDFPCWVYGGKPVNLERLWLLVDNPKGYSYGRFQPRGKFTRIDPRQDGYTGPEFVSYQGVDGGEYAGYTGNRSPGISADSLAWVIVQYEQENRR